MMDIQAIQTDQAPAAIGPYSQAVQTDSLVFVSGQLPIDPQTSQIPSDDITIQTQLALSNLKNILEAGGSSLEKVVKVEVFLTSMDDFAAVNDVYKQIFTQLPYPARQAFEVSRLPKPEAKIEISCIATKC